MKFKVGDKVRIQGELGHKYNNGEVMGPGVYGGVVINWRMDVRHLPIKSFLFEENEQILELVFNGLDVILELLP